MDYQTFKNEISNLKAYYRSLEELQRERERLFYDLTGVKGVRFDRQPGSYNQTMAENFRLEMIEQLDELDKEIEFTCQTIKRYESNLNRLPGDVRTLVILLFIKGKTFSEVGHIVGYSDHGIYHKIKKEIEKL